MTKQLLESIPDFLQLLLHNSILIVIHDMITIRVDVVNANKHPKITVSISVNK